MRQTRDPFHIWVAEIILQQTRMDQGLPYLDRFLNSFPDVATLASAREDDVLRMWQGLGYYSRARHLHASARQVMEQLNGVMPADYQGLLKLKGVGKYTAAAIASWCYNEPRAAVDGNVSRVISRLFGIREPINSTAGENQIYALATKLLDLSDPGMHNQAMIDFGAMQCIPVSPRCGECPLQERCQAHMDGSVDHIPVKVKNKKPADRWFYYYMISSGEETILIQRGNRDIWASLYELPMIETMEPRTEEEIVQKMLPLILHEADPSYTRKPLGIGKLSAPVRHQLSHQTIHARFLQVEVADLLHPLPEKWKSVPREKLDLYAMPRLIHRYLDSVKI